MKVTVGVPVMLKVLIGVVRIVVGNEILLVGKKVGEVVKIVVIGNVGPVIIVVRCVWPVHVLDAITGWRAC